MIYLYSIVILFIAAGASIYSMLRSALTNSAHTGAHTAFCLIICLLTAAPLLYGMFLAVQLQNGGVSADTSMTPAVYAMLLGGVLTIFWHGYRFVSDRRGTHALLAAVGAYLCFAAIDHLQFFWDRSDAGFVNLGYFQETGQVPALPGCNDMALVQGFSAKTTYQEVTYRCPHSIALGGIGTLDVFVPWPGYTQGKSRELHTAIQELDANVVKPAREP